MKTELRDYIEFLVVVALVILFFCGLFTSIIAPYYIMINVFGFNPDNPFVPLFGGICGFIYMFTVGFFTRVFENSQKDEPHYYINRQKFTESEITQALIKEFPERFV